MTKTDIKSIIKEAGEEFGPQSLKRPAPKPKRKRKSKYASEAEKHEAYGVRTTYRIKPATRTAIDRAVEMEDVKKGEFVDFLLRAGLTLLDQGRIQLQKSDSLDGVYDLTLPDIPERYR